MSFWYNTLVVKKISNFLHFISKLSCTFLSLERVVFIKADAAVPLINSPGHYKQRALKLLRNNLFTTAISFCLVDLAQ